MFTEVLVCIFLKMFIIYMCFVIKIKLTLLYFDSRCVNMDFDKFTASCFYIYTHTVMVSLHLKKPLQIQLLYLTCKKPSFSLLTLGLIMNFRYLKYCLFWIQGSAFLSNMLPMSVEFKRIVKPHLLFEKRSWKYYYN